MNSCQHPNLNMPRDGYVFVVTYGRSGSTLLMKLLNSIPDACIRGENGNSLTPLLRSIHDLKNSYNVNVRREQISKAPEDRTHYWRRILGTVDDPWYGAEKIDVDNYARSILDAFIKTVINPPKQASFVGFKDIHFYKEAKYFEPVMNCMLRYFPRSRIIFLTRDLDQVSKSGWWKEMDTDLVLRELGSANDLFRGFYRGNPGATMMFDYEEFSDRDTGVRRVFDFLGADFDRVKAGKIMDVRLNHLK